jgi:diguanylate cyclase (GGDEF)-like protein
MLFVQRFLLRFAALVLLALGASGSAHAEVQLTTCVAPLAPAPTAAAAHQYDCSADQTRFGSGDFSARLHFMPVLSNPADPLVLRMTSVWQDSQRVRFHYADGAVSELSFNSTDARRFMSIGAIFEFPVPARAVPLDGITVETRQSANWRGVVIGAKLLTRSESFQMQSWLVALYAGFGGLSLALLAYNLSLWVVLGHRFQLVYAGMVGALMAYTFTASSLAMYFFTWLDNNDRFRFNYVFLSLSAVIALRFMLSFFGAAIFGPRLIRVINLVSGLTMLSGVAFAVLAPWQGYLLDRFYFAMCSVSLLMVLPIVWCAWRARVSHLGLFLIAWSPPFIVSLLRAVNGVGLIGYSFWLDNGNLIALSVESLLSTLLIIARLRDLSSDRDRARAGEQIAMRLANTDPLTGLLNRRAFLDLALQRPQRQRLMLIDIDHFKAINDRIGHEAGDEVLRQVAKAIQSVRPTDSLAVRLGGEEFALLVPEERSFLCPPDLVLEALRCQTMPLGSKVTASLGYAEGETRDERSWKRLYRLADAALYRAKSDGRNRACHSTDFEEKRPKRRLLATKPG